MQHSFCSSLTFMATVRSPSSNHGLWSSSFFWETSAAWLLFPMSYIVLFWEALLCFVAFPLVGSYCGVLSLLEAIGRAFAAVLCDCCLFVCHSFFLHSSTHSSFRSVFLSFFVACSLCFRFFSFSLCLSFFLWRSFCRSRSRRTYPRFPRYVLRGVGPYLIRITSSLFRS